MRKFDVIIALEGIKEAGEKWRKARREYDQNVALLMRRLIHEAAANYMSDLDVARASGLHIRQVRRHMKAAGLDFYRGKTLLAGKASEVLASNAEIMGIEPHEMDLTSPLAYLPMGSQMRQRLQDGSVSKVTELAEAGEGAEFLETMTEDVAAWWHAHEGVRSVSAEDTAADLAASLLAAGWHK